eukprot:Gb_04767 [translate_table: standard]
MKERRFLVILDDIWEGSEDLVEFLCVPRKRDSKIVFTTRNRRLLSRMGVRYKVSMKPLTREEGWELFKIYAFRGDRYIVTEEFEEIAKKIAGECNGLPLAIKVIGAAMAGERDPEQWQVALEKLQNADTLYPQQKESLFQRLRLSYEALNSTLKACFLYFAAYKEDAVIDVAEISFLWNYEGFFGTIRHYDFLGPGRGLLNSLVDRCLIDVISEDRKGQVWSCKMHDVLRDLALRIAGQEENYLFRAGRDLVHFPVEDCAGRQKISLQYNHIPSIPGKFEARNLRSLLLSGNEGLSKIPKRIMAELTSLRILDKRKFTIHIINGGQMSAGINILVEEILRRLKTAIYCHRELRSMEEVLNHIAPLVRMAISQSHPTGEQDLQVRKWLQSLHLLLENANGLVQGCVLPTYNLFSRYSTAKKLARISTSIDKHINQAAAIMLLHRISKPGDGLEGIQGSASRPWRHQSSERRSPLMDAIPSKLQPWFGPHFIGQESMFNQVQSLIIADAEEDEDCCIGITGMGGAGKTALLQNVINSHPGALDDHLTDEEVQQFIYGTMRERRFLVILDDIWEGSEDLVEFLLVPRKRDSKIVFTTRDRRLLSRMGVRYKVTMKPLTQEEGWELFKIYAFRADRYIVTEEIEKIAKKIAGECRGLPLAIKVIGAAMAGERDPEQWQVALEKLQNADTLYPQQEEGLFQRLRLSYDALNSTLKACFLYFAAFKEDAVIDVAEISFLWNYEGFFGTIRPYDFLGPGRGLLNSLVDRCLIDVISEDRKGQVRSCKMHDVLRDLALRISGQEENYLFRAGRDLSHFPVEDCAGRQKISLQDNYIPSIPGNFKAGNLRTLLLSGNERLSKIPKGFMAKLTSLRILDLRRTSITGLPKSVGLLKHLVCLRLSETAIEFLPESLLGLEKLQALDLSRSSLKKLPQRISNLRSLRILDLDSCRNLRFLPLGITRLVSLQVLNMASCPLAWEWDVIKLRNQKASGKEARLNDLQTLTALRCLQIENWKDSSISVGTMSSFSHMERLDLNMNNLAALPEDMAGMTRLRQLWLSCQTLRALPLWMVGLQNLRGIALHNCWSLKDVPSLDVLRGLRRLEIHRCTALKKLPRRFGSWGSFPALMLLWLKDLTELEELPAMQEGSMPRLQVLGVELCARVKRLPEGMEQLNELKVLGILGSDELLRSTRQGGQDWERALKLEREKNVKIFRERNLDFGRMNLKK